MAIPISITVYGFFTKQSFETTARSAGSDPEAAQTGMIFWPGRISRMKQICRFPVHRNSRVQDHQVCRFIAEIIHSRCGADHSFSAVSQNFQDVQGCVLLIPGTFNNQDPLSISPDVFKLQIPCRLKKKFPCLPETAARICSPRHRMTPECPRRESPPHAGPW